MDDVRLVRSGAVGRGISRYGGRSGVVRQQDVVRFQGVRVVLADGADQQPEFQGDGLDQPDQAGFGVLVHGEQCGPAEADGAGAERQCLRGPAALPDAPAGEQAVVGAADAGEALAEREPHLAEEGGRRPCGAALGAVHGDGVRAGRPGGRRGVGHVAAGVQLHPHLRAGEVVPHEPDLLAQDLLGEGAGAADPQHRVAVGAEHRVHGVLFGDPAAGLAAEDRETAEAGLGALADLQLEGEPAGGEQRLGHRVAVDQVPHLGVGVLGGLLHHHAAVLAVGGGRVGGDPAEQWGDPGVGGGAVAVDRDHVLADDHRDAELSGLPSGRLAQVVAGDLRRAERGHVERQPGGEPADQRVQFDVRVQRLTGQVDELLQPLRHEHRGHDPGALQQVVRVLAGRDRAQQAAAVGLQHGEGPGRSGPGPVPHLFLGEARSAQYGAHADTTPGSFG